MLSEVHLKLEYHLHCYSVILEVEKEVENQEEQPFELMMKKNRKKNDPTVVSTTLSPYVLVLSDGWFLPDLLTTPPFHPCKQPIQQT